MIERSSSNRNPLPPLSPPLPLLHPTTEIPHPTNSVDISHTMASKTKYQPAPTRDSFEEQGYSQPPPSYQAEAANAPAGAFGAPRSEDDNLPDDFKVRNIR